MIVPSFSALLSDSSWQVIRYLCPLLRPLEVYEAQQKSVFDLGPWAFNQSWIEDFLPSVEALDVSSSGERLRDLFPIFAAIYSYRLCQFLVLLLCPMAFYLHIRISFMYLSCLVLRWPSLVKMRIKHLVTNKLLLSLAISEITKVLWNFHLGICAERCLVLGHT